MNERAIPRLGRAAPAVACLTLVFASAAGAAPKAIDDEIHLGARQSAFLDLFANDSNITGGELSTSVNSAGATGFTVEDHGDGTILITRIAGNGAPSQGDQTFTYRVTEPSGAQDVGQVRVCWGNAPCVALKSDDDDDEEEPTPAPEPEPPPEEPQPGTCAGGLCFVVGGIRYLSGQTADFGAQASGTERVVPVTVENNLGRELRIAAVVTNTQGDRSGMRFASSGDFGPLLITIPAGGSAALDVRHIYLPTGSADPGVTNVRGLLIVDKTDPSQDGTSWAATFLDRGLGPFVIPSFEDCQIHDVCLYAQGIKVASMLGGSGSHTHNFGTVTVGSAAALSLKLVHNGVPGDGGAIPFQFLPAPGFKLLAGGTAQTVSTVGIRQVLDLTLEWRPEVEGTLSRDIELIAGLAGSHLKFRVTGQARLQGEACELCAITLDGRPFANGSTLAFGTRPSGETLRIRGTVRNGAPRGANTRLAVAGPNRTLFQISGWPASGTIPAGVTVEFELLVLFRPGTNTAQLELRDPILGIPIHQSVTLTSTGTGTVPAPPGFGACSTTLYAYCVFVGGRLVEARPHPNKPPLNPPNVLPIHDFGTLGFLGEASVRAAIVNNSESTLPFQEMLDRHGPIAITRDGVPVEIAAVGVFPNNVFEFDVKFRNTFPLRSQTADGQTREHDIGVVRLILGLAHEVVTLLVGANCVQGGCGLFDYGPFLPLVNQQGYAGLPRAQYIFPLVVPYVADAGAPPGPIRVRFGYRVDAAGQTPHPSFIFRSAGTATAPEVSLPSGFAYIDEITAASPAVAGSMDRAYLVQWLNGSQFVIPHAQAVIARSPLDQFDGCPGVCVYRYMDREADQYVDAAPADLLGILGQQPASKPVIRTTKPPPFFQNLDNVFVIANNTDATRRISARVNRRDGSFVLNRTGSKDILEYSRHIPPRRLLVGHLTLVAGQYVNTDEMVVTDLDTGSSLAIDLINDPGRPNADCRDLCVTVGGGARVANGSSVPVTGSRTAPTITTVRIVNGALTAQPFEFRLRGADGFLASTDTYTVSGSACAAQSDTHRCSGTIAGGTAIDLTVSYKMDAMRVGGFETVVAETIVGASVHAMTLQGRDCTGVCLTSGAVNLANGAAYSLGMSQIGVEEVRFFTVVNASAANVDLTGSTLSGGFSLSGATGVLAPFSEKTITLRIAAAPGANAGTLTLKNALTQSVLTTLHLDMQGVNFALVPLKRDGRTVLIPLPIQ